MSVFLAAVLLLTCAPFAGIEVKAAAEEYFEYEVENGEATITYCDRSINGDVVIPDTLGGYSVTGIGWAAFRDCVGLTSIAIPDSVTSIGGYAFEGCTNLTSITIPDSVTSIGGDAFRDCTGLISITIPDSVTSIGSDAFRNTAYYNNSDNWENDVLYIGNHLIRAELSLSGVYEIKNGTKTIAVDAFWSCHSLISVVIPDSVTSIDSNSFYGCYGLTSVTIPDSVTSIGDEAFYNTAYYNNSDNWENGVLYIGNHLIKAKDSISSAYEIKDGTKTIADYAFYGCESFTSITIPGSVTSIGDAAFKNCTELISIIIPDSVTSIGDATFYGCTDLTSATIPDSVTNIDGWTFAHCISLTSITIPDSVTNIGSHAFHRCTGLTSITVSPENTVYHSTNNCLIETDKKKLITGCKNSVIPADGSVTSIGYDAFYDCTGLTSITIPDSVTSIGDSAFYDCSGLTSVTIGISVTSIGEEVFHRCIGLTSITIGSNVTSIGYKAFYECANLTSITIPDSVTSIGDMAFSGCTGLTSITIPDSVTEIGRYAFGGCTGLTSVTIPNSVTTIGDDAFYYCTGLTSITIPSSVTYIGDRAFGYYYCDGEFIKLPSFTIYGYPGTAAETYANKNGFIFIALGEATDEATGITVEYSPKSYSGAVELKAEQVFDGKVFEVLESSTASSKKVLFDITTLVDGKKAQPNGNVTVKIPLPNGYNPNKTAVYYVTDSGTLERIPCTVEGGYVVFETTHFSFYAVVDETPDTPDQPDNPSENCSCACHKKGIVKFFFKIGLFFQKIFKKNKICKCGVYHY